MEFTRTILDALKHWVNGRFSNIEKALEGKQPSGDYALKSEIPSLEGIATEEYVDNALAEFVPGEGEGSVQSDYEQNDSEAADYIKNRPFYTGGLVETEIADINAIVAENNIKWMEESQIDDTTYSWICQLPTVFTLEVGKNYTFVINGERYSTVGKDLTSVVGMAAIGFGDIEALITGNYDAYVYGGYIINNMMCAIGCKGETPPTEFKIYTPEQEIVKIDPKYLPEGGVGYDGSALVEIVPECTVEITTEGEPAPLQSIALTSGNVYTVIFDGVVYECEAYTLESVVCIGNSSFADFEGLGNNEPFLCATLVNGVFSSVGTHTIKIEGIVGGIHKIDPKFLPDHTQSDWNESDPNAESYIENRPFYEECVAGDVLFEEQEIECDGAEVALATLQTTFIEGEIYFVTFNGTQYKCVAWTDEILSEAMGVPAIGIGNLSTSMYFTNSYGNNEPFCVVTGGDDSILWVNEPGVHAIKIQASTFEVVKKIDKKFLPDDIGGVKSVNGLEPDENGNIEINVADGFSGSWNDLADKPFYGGKRYVWSSEIVYTERDEPENELLGIAYVKISDDVPDKSEVVGGNAFVLDNSFQEIPISSEAIIEAQGCYLIGETFIVVTADYLESDPVYTKGVWAPDLSGATDSASGGAVKELGFTTRVKTIDEKYIPDTISRTNHTHRWNDLLDKPFGEYINTDLIDVAELLGVNSTPLGDGRYFMAYAFAATAEMCSLEVGKEYTVTINGNSYTDIAVDGSFITPGTVCIGDVKAAQSQDIANLRYMIACGPVYMNGEPTGAFQINVYYVGTESELTECVMPIGETQLDEKYIPDTIARKDDFYSYEKKNLIYKGKITTDTIVASGLHSEAQGYFPDNSFILDQNKKYVVNFDGTDYVCKVNSDVDNYCNIGNLYMVTLFALRNETEEVKNSKLAMVNIVDTKEPFCISVLHDGTDCSIITKEAGTYSIQIYEAEVHEINDAYISSTFACANDLYGQVDGRLTMRVYYEWDENVVYDEVVNAPDDSYAYGMAKISSDAPESDFFVGKYLYITGHDTFGTRSVPVAMIKTSDIITQDGYYVIGNYIIVVTSDSINFNGIELTQGIWCADGWNRSQNMWVSNIRITDSKKILVDTIIPDSVARVKNVVTTPVTAQVKQAIVAKSVDENGRPVEWEAVNVPIIPNHIYEWHVDTEYSDRITSSNPNVSFVKISDEVIPSSSLVNGTFAALTSERPKDELREEIGELDIEQHDGYYQLYKVVLFVTADTASFTFVDDIQVTLSKGVWVADLAVEGFTDVYISTYGKPVDEFIIPDTIARVSDVVTNPVAAQVGQTIVVKAVDENGRPVEWEAVDLPTGSGLPPVTAEDEGKILRVVNGVPTWVSLPYAEEAEF